MNSSNQVAIVTGGASGIGKSIAEALGKNQCKVAILDTNVEKGLEAAENITDLGGECIFVSCNVGSSQSVSQAIEEVEASLGAVDILINNAGVGGPFHRVDEVSDDEWDWIIHTNLKSVFLFARDLLPKMAQREYGRIINIASIQGLLGSSYSSTYVASKHGMIGYTKTIAAEWGHKGITCNAICPGYIQSGLGVQTNLISDYMERVMEKSPVKRIGTPEEIAGLVLYLTGPLGGYVNGTSLTVDGGISSHVGITSNLE